MRRVSRRVCVAPGLVRDVRCQRVGGGRRRLTVPCFWHAVLPVRLRSVVGGGVITGAACRSVGLLSSQLQTPPCNMKLYFVPQ